jgi:phosphatidylglycerophosphatase A
VVGFLIFRILDIWKPGPIGYIDEEVPGAPGTVLDDVLAGAVGAVIIYFIFHHQY